MFYWWIFNEKQIQGGPPFTYVNFFFVILNLYHNFYGNFNSDTAQPPAFLCQNFFLCHNIHTHGLIKLFIAAMAYYIKPPWRSEVWAWQVWAKRFQSWDLFWKICTSLYANFRKKISFDTSCGRSKTLPWFFM